MSEQGGELLKRPRAAGVFGGMSLPSHRGGAGERVHGALRSSVVPKGKVGGRHKSQTDARILAPMHG